jgi:hypothetical protein
MVAGATGKIGIIRQSRDAKTVTTTRYSKVRDDIKGYLCNAARTPRLLDALRNKYASMANDTALGSWAREDARLSLDVLASLARMENRIAGGRFLAPPVKQLPLMLGGVSVSVNLNVLMVRERQGKEEVGGILFRLTKADEETDAAAEKRQQIGSFAATLALMQVQSGMAGDRIPHHQICASFDIQCEDVHWAPRNYAAKARDIENECRFIAAMWETA